MPTHVTATNPDAERTSAAKPVDSSPSPNTDDARTVADITPSSETTTHRQPPPTRCRMLMTVSLFLVYAAIYSQRAHLGITLTAMINSTYVVHHQQHQQQQQKPSINLTRRRADCKPFPRRDPETGEKRWDSNEQGVVLSAFYYGYVVAQLASGCVGASPLPRGRVTGKCLLLCGSLLTAVVTILTPVLTQLADLHAFVVCRVAVGVGQGVVLSSSNVVLSLWSSPRDGSTINSVIYAGSQLGTVISLPLSAVLCQYVGWPAIFYAVGGLGAASWPLMLCLVYDRPATHPRLDTTERDYIATTVTSQPTRDKLKSVKVPWNDILRSGPVISLVLAHFANNCVYSTLLSCLPLYFHFILRFSTITNSLLCCLSFCGTWIVMLVAGRLAERLRTARTLSTTSVRKLFCAAGFLVPAACFVALPFVHCNRLLSVSLIVIGQSLLGISMSCWAVNHLDLAPPFARQLMNFSNLAGSIPGVVAPSIVGALTYDYPASSESWRHAFFIIAGFLALATVVYWMFGSGQRQWWAIYVEMTQPLPLAGAPPGPVQPASDADKTASAAYDAGRNTDSQSPLANNERTKLDSAEDGFAAFVRRYQLQTQESNV